MSVIKKYNLGDGFDDKKSFPKVSGGVLKSSLVVSSQDVAIAGSSSSSMRSRASDSIDMDSFDDSFSSASSISKDSAFDAPPTIASEPSVSESEVRNSVMAELQGHVDELVTAVSNLKEARDSVIKSSESQLVEFALLIAEKVIAKKIEQDPELINAVISDTFDKISGSDRIIFKINPADADVVSAFQPTIEARLVGVEKITIQQDSTIQPGGCIIETDLGFVDVTIQEKLNLITQTFKKIKSVL